MGPGDVKEHSAASAAVYDQLPLRTWDGEMPAQNPDRNHSATSSGAVAGESKANPPSNSVGSDRPKDVVKLPESERMQLYQRHELLVDQHEKIDYSLQVILDEIASLKAQAAEENDLNVLMVQFIVMAVKLLVEAAFNKDKVEELLPTLEAEFQRLQLPSRHPRLLACFNRLREVCGKPPVTESDLATKLVVVSVTDADGAPPSKSSPVSKPFSGQEVAPAAAAAATAAEPSVAGASRRDAPARSGGLVDDSEDEKRSSSPLGSKDFPAVVVHDSNSGEPPAAKPAELMPSRSLDSAFRREPVFTPGERRRTATAFGDGDLPLFQQFAAAGAAPAPDECQGLGKPLDTALLSQAPKGTLMDRMLVEEAVVREAQELEMEGDLSGSGSSEMGYMDAVQRNSLQSGSRGSLYRDWASERNGKRAESGPDLGADEGPSELGDSTRSVKALSTFGEGGSFDGLLKHATTILSMSPSELRAALLRSTHGAKSDGALRVRHAHRVVHEDELSGRLDSEGPPAPMHSLAAGNSKDHIQLLQDAMVAVAVAAAGELRERSKEKTKTERAKEGQAVNNGSSPSRGESGNRSKAAAAVVPAQGNGNAQKMQTTAQQAGALKVPQCKVLGAESGASDKALPPSRAGENGRCGDLFGASVVGSPITGRTAPPPTPDMLANPKREEAAAPASAQEFPFQNAGMYLPANQLAWQQFFDKAAASVMQRREREYLESQAMAQGQWIGQTGSVPPVYSAAMSYSVPGTSVTETDAALGRGVVPVGAPAAFQPSMAMGPTAQGLVDPAYVPPVVSPLPAVKIAVPKPPNAGPAHCGSGKQQVVASRVHAQQVRAPEVASLNAPIIVSQDNTFETPRTEGNWVCCRRVQRDGNKNGKAANQLR
ncbi:hypothetical protein, conserved [Eimeria tenella]|uniref:Uncharacterized protein n=1 Tax=Eimeria tenella TaxID=5802 RepID=U6KWQ3_EIMTE|nr:hypothetical protein, conserved [Eimeria tenella]CDJ42562.1 hypothetical protein, conserved [Eimeria tenella]|eukprot:XP_013233312.1 hypothetical protein, conserved [Eimeria tenella]